MVFPRAASLKTAFTQSAFRRAGAQARTRAWRQIGRRSYASEHGSQKSSDLPWIIGSVVVTVPSAAWLWSQGPTKSEHGHGHEEHEEHAEGEDKPEEGEEAEAKDDDGEEKPKEKADDDDSKDGDEKDDKDGKDDQDAKKDKKPKDDSKDEDSDSEGGDDKDTPPTSDDEDSDKPSPGSPGQINKNGKKGTGELHKGDRKSTEKKGEKDSQSASSGAKHPYIDDDEKSKKGEGIADTAKVHGTVDSRRDAK